MNEPGEQTTDREQTLQELRGLIRICSSFEVNEAEAEAVTRAVPVNGAREAATEDTLHSSEAFEVTVTRSEWGF